MVYCKSRRKLKRKLKRFTFRRHSKGGLYNPEVNTPDTNNPDINHYKGMIVNHFGEHLRNMKNSAKYHTARAVGEMMVNVTRPEEFPNIAMRHAQNFANSAKNSSTSSVQNLGKKIENSQKPVFKEDSKSAWTLGY
jgi:hypothetical protein